MEIKRINQNVVTDNIDGNLSPQIKWIPNNEGWTYVFVPGDCEILVKNTKSNREFLMNLLRAMKQEIVLKQKGLKEAIERDIRTWFNKNIPLRIN